MFLLGGSEGEREREERIEGLEGEREWEGKNERREGGRNSSRGKDIY